MTCPDCGADRSEPIAWGTDIASIVLRNYYPDARECKACGAAWSPRQLEDRKKTREMLSRLCLSNLGKAPTLRPFSFGELVERECAAAHAAMDAKEAAIDAHGYGKPAEQASGELVGLGEYIPGVRR